jgi:hypothetical protein
MADDSSVQPPAAENTSGQGGAVPAEVMGMGFNWGAFWLTWIWGIAHGVWNSFLVLVLNIIWSIVLGVKGNEWAWRSRRFDSVEQFRQTQAVWSKWGWILFIIWLVLAVIVMLLAGAAILAALGIAASAGATVPDINY